MSTTNDILNELRGLNSPLADMSRATPYALPKGYFEDLTGYTQSIPAVDQDFTTPGWSRKMPYAVPQGYFAGLPQRLLEQVSEPELGFLPKHNPLSVPAGYFDALPQNLLNTIRAAEAAEEQKPQTKVIPLGNKLWRSVRWAAAAVVILGIGIGSYTFLRDAPRTVTPQQALSSLSENTINEYVQQNIDEFDMEMIENTVAANTTTEQLDASLLTDEEIRLYLEETEWETEIN